MLSTEFIPYNSANESTFQTIFLPPEYRDGIFSIDTFIDLLQYIVSNVGLRENLIKSQTTKSIINRTSITHFLSIQLTGMLFYMIQIQEKYSR